MNWDMRPVEAAAADEFAALRLFLPMIAGGDRDHSIEIRHFPGPRQEWLHAADARAAATRIVRLACRREVYVGAVPRRRAGGGKDACGRAWALWADCDSRQAVDALMAFTPEPTFVVMSGGTEGSVPKRHAWWALREPLDRDDAERALARLARHLDADAACAEVARVMRPPATLHRKHGEVRRVTVARASAVVHDPGAVVAHLADPPPRAAAPPRPPPAALLLADDPLRLIPATEYVRALTGRELGRDGKVACPFHANGTPSLHVYGDGQGWFCFGCDAGGSVIDLGAHLYGITPRGRGYNDIRRRLAADLLAEHDA
jgi:CHC2-type zinc finger protein